MFVLMNDTYCKPASVVLEKRKMIIHYSESAKLSVINLVPIYFCTESLGIDKDGKRLSILKFTNQVYTVVQN